MTQFDGATRLFAVLGHPVHHSLSPPMQNAAFEARERNAVYVALDVAPTRLAEALIGLHAAGVEGLNLTLPHKEAGFRLLAGATPEARAAGAANTLRRVAAGWEGHATDGVGFLDWLEALGIGASGARVLLIGAGGAARSMAAALVGCGAAELQIVNRSLDRARDLASGLGASSTRIEAASLDDEPPARAQGGTWDLLVRAVSSESIGLSESRWWSGLVPAGIALDSNYGARARGARAEAARAGVRFEDGLGLLLYQGALSFEFWTGLEAPRAAMRRALEEVSGSK